MSTLIWRRTATAKMTRPALRMLLERGALGRQLFAIDFDRPSNPRLTGGWFGYRFEAFEGVVASTHWQQMSDEPEWLSGKLLVSPNDVRRLMETPASIEIRGLWAVPEGLAGLPASDSWLSIAFERFEFRDRPLIVIVEDLWTAALAVPTRSRSPGAGQAEKRRERVVEIAIEVLTKPGGQACYTRKDPEASSPLVIDALAKRIVEIGAERNDELIAKVGLKSINMDIRARQRDILQGTSMPRAHEGSR